ncbi:hypothetical protein [Streptomyces sp. NPDC005805]|uniref:hypothetical protein n=1 Tax=Streptomyces sp. NPDC005805 TaxID=3157068 RepID=UPI00340639E5
MPSQHDPSRAAEGGTIRIGAADAETVVVEHYVRLVRLAYLTLPPTLGRHRRVLAAHSLVQRALPARRTAAASGSGTASARRGAEGPAYRWVRQRVLRAALRRERRPGRWPARALSPAALRPSLPVVLGLRLFPSAGGADELALDRALSALPGPARAAVALRVLEGLEPAEVLAVLSAARVADPQDAVRAAGRLRTVGAASVESLLTSAEFDPSRVQTRPTDLLRRRHAGRLAAAVTATAAVTAVLATLASGTGGHGSAPAAGPPGPGLAARATEPAALRAAESERWADSSRVDFSVWPARGDRTEDSALLGRALRALAGGTDARVSATSGTSTAPAAEPPQLLYAGEVDGVAVVLLHDGRRLVRYAEPVAGGGRPVLDLARTDDADVTTAAAVVISRSETGARYLLAPWIAESTTRDLLRPDIPARAVAVRGGITAEVPRPRGGQGCTSWPALQLRSSERIVEKHSFLVTDLGDLAPVHLTWTPPPSAGHPPRQPREATGAPGLASWARSACLLPSLRGTGVRSVNNWVFAEQSLPDGGGRASWVCTRAETWRGPGRVLVQLQEPGGRRSGTDPVLAEAGDTAACSRFGQHVLAGATWRSPRGNWFVLAAGSRAVTGIRSTGDVTADADGRTLAARAEAGDRPRLVGRLRDGGELAPLG